MTVKELIDVLETFEDKSIEVMISEPHEFGPDSQESIDEVLLVRGIGADPSFVLLKCF